jgi:hypothetical protein
VTLEVVPPLGVVERLMNFFYCTFVSGSDFSSLNFAVSTNLDAGCCAAGIEVESPEWCASHREDL